MRARVQSALSCDLSDDLSMMSCSCFLAAHPDRISQRSGSAQGRYPGLHLAQIFLVLVLLVLLCCGASRQNRDGDGDQDRDSNRDSNTDSDSDSASDSRSYNIVIA